VSDEPWWTTPKAAIAAVLLSAVLMIPSLWSGFASDDWFFVMAFTGKGSPGLAVTPGVLVAPGSAPAAMASGTLSWTADPGFAVAFWRPLPIFTHQVDFWLWPGHPVWHHAQNVLWSSLLVAAAALVYRRFLADPRAAAWATLLLAVEDNRATTVGWISNRNLLMGTTFVLVALLAYDQARRSADARWHVVGLGSLLAALASSEGAVAGLGLLVLYAALRDDRRWLPVGPYAALTAGWLVAWSLRGAGVRGSSHYADFDAGLLSVAGHVVAKAPVLVAGQLAGLWTDLANVFPTRWPPLTLAALTSIAAISWLGRRALWGPEARFWWVAVFVAAAPVSLAPPGDRVLPLVSVGAAALWGMFLATPRTGLARVFGWWVLATHLWVSAPMSALRARGMVDVEEVLVRASDTLRADDGAPERTLVMISVPTDAIPPYVAMRRVCTDVPTHGHLRALFSGISAVDVERPSERSLRLTPARGWLASAPEQLARDPARRPFRVGDTVDLPGVAVVVEQVTSDGRPAVVRFDFEAPLEDPRYDWHTWDVFAFRRFEVPPVGGSVHLDAVDPVTAFLGPPPWDDTVFRP
jgi:hypothetical protein